MIQQEVFDWRVNNFNDYPTALKGALIIAEETGEIARAVLKREQAIRGTYEQWSDELKLEMAQTTIALLVLAELEGFDLLEAVEKYFLLLKQRNFKTDSIGHGLPDA
jgi:NTP pyrophosphatase (non-canonical NTP hydrolase)